MRLIKPSFEIWEQGDTQKDILKHVEKCGRICYASLDKITDDSYQKFVDMIRKNGHLSVMEHGTIYMLYQGNYDEGIKEIMQRYDKNPYSKIEWYINNNNILSLYITTNLRVLLENDWKGEYIIPPTKHHQKRVTVCIICDRAIANEIVRHRKFSYSQQSTRYCNYTKDRFDNMLTFIIPNIYQRNLREGYYKAVDYGILGIDNDGTRVGYWTDDSQDDYYWWMDTMRRTEGRYFDLIKRFKMKPEYARNILPLSLATKLVMTGFIDDWKHFFELRTSKRAHPQMREIAIPLMEEFIRRGYINDNEITDGKE